MQVAFIPSPNVDACALHAYITLPPFPNTPPPSQIMSTVAKETPSIPRHKNRPSLPQTESLTTPVNKLL